MHHNDRFTYGLIFLVLVLVGGAIWSFMMPRTKTTQVFLGNTTYSMTVVSSDAARDQALKKSKILEGNKGVMIAYPEAGAHQVSLKILRQKTDVIWLNSEKEIIHQAKGLPAISVNKKLGPTDPSQYVLFFRQGTIDQQKTIIGSAIDFDLNSLW